MSHLEYNPNASYQPQTNYQPMYPSQPQPQPQYYQQQQPQHPYQHSQHQQQIGIIIRERTDEWDGGLFDCCSDVETCVKAMICMPIFLAIEKAEWDGTHCCLNFCCTTMLPLRHQVRTVYGIEGNCCADVCISFFCTCCAAAQLMRTMRANGPLFKPARMI